MRLQQRNTRLVRAEQLARLARAASVMDRPPAFRATRAAGACDASAAALPGVAAPAAAGPEAPSSCSGGRRARRRSEASVTPPSCWRGALWRRKREPGRHTRLPVQPDTSRSRSTGRRLSTAARLASLRPVQPARRRRCRELHSAAITSARAPVPSLPPTSNACSWDRHAGPSAASTSAGLLGGQAAAWAAWQ